MNRKEIKSKAREIIKGNKWLILKPIVYILILDFIGSFLGNFIDGLMNVKSEDTLTIGSTITYIWSLITGMISVAYYVYILKFIRTGSACVNDVVDCFKKKWKEIFVAQLLVTIFVMLWSLLFVVPGIIAVYAYVWAFVLVVDENLKPRDAINKSKLMMKGNKWNYFVFELSFMGWNILAILTLGILYIWLYPYMLVSNMLYYEKLKELNN